MEVQTHLNGNGNGGHLNGIAATSAPKPPKRQRIKSPETALDAFPGLDSRVKAVEMHAAKLAISHADYEGWLETFRAQRRSGMLRRRYHKGDAIDATITALISAGQTISEEAGQLGEKLLQAAQLIRRELHSNDWKYGSFDSIGAALRWADAAYNIGFPFCDDDVPPAEEREALIAAGTIVVALLRKAKEG